MNVQTRTARPGAYAARDEEIVELLRDVNRALRERLMEGATGTDRSLASLSLLRAVGKEPGISLNELARRKYMPKSLVSLLIGDLTRDRLVRKARDPADQRLVRLSLSAAGTKELERWRATYRAIAAEAVGTLSSEDAVALQIGLRALRDAVMSPGAPR
jgi:DNA-binding MarR family transcriptional regulator